MHFRAVGYFVT